MRYFRSFKIFSNFNLSPPPSKITQTQPSVAFLTHADAHTDTDAYADAVADADVTAYTDATLTGCLLNSI